MVTPRAAGRSTELKSSRGSLSSNSALDRTSVRGPLANRASIGGAFDPGRGGASSRSRLGATSEEGAFGVERACPRVGTTRDLGELPSVAADGATAWRAVAPRRLASVGAVRSLLAVGVDDIEGSAALATVLALMARAAARLKYAVIRLFMIFSPARDPRRYCSCAGLLEPARPSTGRLRAIVFARAMPESRPRAGVPRVRGYHR
jgi:hypothetical protein